MAGTFRQLLPHFFAMFLIYGIAVIAVWMAFEVQSFWISLAIALGIAITYPTAVRSLGIEPEPWRRD